MSSSIICQHCHVAFKYKNLYEGHLRADKSCPDDPIELHYLHMILPTSLGQRRCVQINTVIPIRIEMRAVLRDKTLRWSTVSVISDASFPPETP